jgi:hypothetical protein
VQSLWKPVKSFLKKLKIELPYNSATLLLDIYPKECKSTYDRYTCTTIIIEAIFSVINFLFLLELALNHDLLNSDYYIFGITGAYHHRWPYHCVFKELKCDSVLQLIISLIPK